MTSQIELLRRLSLAFQRFQRGESMEKAAMSHGVELADLEGMIRNFGNESMTEIAAEIVRQLEGDPKEDVEFVRVWILHRVLSDAPLDNLVAEFSIDHKLPSKQQ